MERQFEYRGECGVNKDFRFEKWATRFMFLAIFCWIAMWFFDSPLRLILFGGWVAFTLAFIGRHIYFKYNLPYHNYDVVVRSTNHNNEAVTNEYRLRAADDPEAELKGRYAAHCAGLKNNTVVSAARATSCLS